MRVGVDARELTGRPTGVGRYLLGLLREWSRNATHTHAFVLYAHQTLAISSTGVDGCEERVLPGSGGTLWEQRDLARAIARDRIDVLFSPAYSTPLLTSTPRVVALHDISFAAHPEWFRWREGARRRLLARRAAAAAHAVITISQFSKREIVDRFGVDPDAVHVVPPGIDPPVMRHRTDGASDTGAVLLYVGSVFNRRHVADLIVAFGRVARRHPDASLHIVGENRTYPHEDLAEVIASERLDSRVFCHDYVSDERLRELYACARGFVFLSEYEGLGLTPLEALASAVPSLLLDTAVARESCGDAALYVSSTAPANVAAAIEQLLFDQPGRRAVLNAAPAVLARYDWPRAAAETLRIISSAAQRRDAPNPMSR